MNNLRMKSLSKSDLILISGGFRRIPWNKMKKLGKKLWDAITATDAYLAAKEGWNSVECN
ncbi:MAG: hypothetical protein RI575_04515 [Balneolaceae bacterium]|nr:hypothetical protein [Balneolaceae bacterium]